MPKVPTVPTLTASRQAVNRALVLAPDLVEARATQAYLLYVLDWNWPAADSAFQQAIAHGPNDSTTYKWYSDVLDVLGRFPDAQRVAERARELDPVSSAALATLGFMAFRRGDDADAMRLLDQALALDPSQPHALRQIVSLLIDNGDSTRFLAMQERLVASSELAGAPTALLRRAWQSGGREAAIRVQIATFDNLNSPYEAARWREKSGDLDGMFRDLDRAHAAHVIWMAPLKLFFNRSPAARDPRFKALLAKTKIAEDNP